MGLVSRRGEEDEGRAEVKITGFGDLDGDRPDEMLFELDDWSEAGRRLLGERLTLLGAPHTWEGATLVVSETDEAWVERVLDQVEDELSVSLDPDVEQVGYDLAGWDDVNRSVLVEALEDEAIAFAMEGDELFVHEIDEQRVDELVNVIVEPEGEPSAGGEARTEVMGELFVGADRLVHEPGDSEGRRTIADGAQVAATAGPPYGMDRAWWEDIGVRCTALVATLHAVPVDEDLVVEQATGLRDALRPFV
ncbi:MAG: hypothetical protein Q8K58_09540 [Acidimicrobiales bacterium]|nr:hypothetical protein [Acidimicrobiales bacterium]